VTKAAFTQAWLSPDHVIYPSLGQAACMLSKRQHRFLTWDLTPGC
jgi:hypothetical protein